MNHTRIRVAGFSLIELLVVIAIIGILTSITLPSLNLGRERAGDAAVKMNLGNVRAQAIIYYENNSYSYGPGSGTSCTTASSVFSDENVTRQIQAAVTAAGGGAVATCANSTTKWTVSVPLREGGAWCVDSSGSARASTANTTTISCS